MKYVMRTHMDTGEMYSVAVGVNAVGNPVHMSWHSRLAAEGVFFFQAEDGIRDYKVTGVQTCALPISREPGDEGRPQRHSGDPRANAVEQRVVLLTRAGPLHALQDRIRRVLERQIDV